MVVIGLLAAMIIPAFHCVQSAQMNRQYEAGMTFGEKEMERIQSYRTSCGLPLVNTPQTQTVEIGAAKIQYQTIIIGDKKFYLVPVN